MKVSELTEQELIHVLNLPDFCCSKLGDEVEIPKELYES